jgi:putative spermidine/putrescine transport system permease protein
LAQHSQIGSAEVVETTIPSGHLAQGAVPTRARSTRRRSWAWLGLLPFFAFLFIFLILPVLGVADKALTTSSGGRSFKPMSDALSGERDAFWSSVRLSLISAATGAVVGALLAYAAATARRPKWLRTVVTAFCGVSANMGGVVLAFAFLTLIGRAGVATKIFESAGYHLYGSNFRLSSVAGLTIVYLYFQIPLMLLVTLPAIDGLKQSWREASSNLGGTSWTYWRRVGLPVLSPSLLGGFLLLFANAFSAFATAYALGTGDANLVPIKISFFLQGDIAGVSAKPYALATWMIIFMIISMAGYLLLRRRSERWTR